MTLKLVSFSVCPFVQRAVLMLNEKGVDFEVQYIDLSNKPDWFLKLSPRGKVPILVADEEVLFESQAICEYLEEAHPSPRLMPEKLTHRARDRAWFAFSGEDLFGPLWRLETADTQEKVDDARTLIDKALTRVAQEMEGRDWLSGDGRRFGMADVAMTPALYRIASHLPRGLDLLEKYPSLRPWSERVLAKDSVKRSVPDAWKEDHDGYMKKSGAVLAA